MAILELKTGDPEFWTQAEKAEKVMREIKGHRSWISLYENATRELDDLELMFEYYKAQEVTESELIQQKEKAMDLIDDLEVRSTLNDPEDSLNCVVEINSGAGGTESCDWVEMLYRMYAMWAEKNNYRLKEISALPDDVAGYRSVAFEIEGEFAYGMLKKESGVHRLVRISPFNSQGKRQTTFASVFVYPMVDDSIQIDLNPADVTMETFRSSGAGGQHVNKTDSAVRLRHAPSGLVVECQQERSQHMNRDKAMQMLKSRLYELEIQKRNAERDKIEASKQKIEWGSQIRNYVLHPYKMVKDIRSGFETSQAQDVLDGNLMPFLKAQLLAINVE